MNIIRGFIMDIFTQCEFAKYYYAFKSCNHNISDIGYLIETIRFNRLNMSDNAKLKMLEIPLNVLQNQCVLKKSMWDEGTGSYFAGNIIVNQESRKSLKDIREQFVLNKLI